MTPDKETYITREAHMALQRKLKTILEQEIQKQIETFEKCSGLRVDSIHIDRNLCGPFGVRTEIKL